MACVGLVKLATLDRVSVRQKSKMVNSKYAVFTPDGSPLLVAREESSLLGQILGGTSRAFHIDVYDSDDRLVMKLRRPYTVGPDKMEVTVEGQLAAVVRQKMTLMTPVLTLHDAEDAPILKVKGPLSTSGEADFDVFNQSKQQIGVISKKWGRSREVLTNSDNFLIRFPVSMDVNLKAALIGTCFLIDFLYYGC